MAIKADVNIMSDDYYLGIDGCQAGWFCVIFSEKEFIDFNISQTIKEIWLQYNKAKTILVDIPIGLLENSSEPRKCDKAARQFLTRIRSSSVFPVPCRAAIYANDYIEAKIINREKTGKGLSKQSWNISPKIRDVDEFLRNNKHLKEIIVESHPEVCFTALNGGKPMIYYKKTPEGFKERISILKKYSDNAEEFIQKIFSDFDFSRADKDDLIDACVLALSASWGPDNWKFLPYNYDFDSEGLPMRMAYPNV
ncbi:MAG: DUF429 domain-containing protein [Promethearchaeota archaeon]